MKNESDPSTPPSESDATSPSASGDEVTRVAAFLRWIECAKTAHDERLNTARAAVVRLEKESVELRQELSKRSAELESLRAEYDADLKNRGETTAVLTQQFLQEKFAGQFKQIRAELEAQQQERIEQLNDTIRRLEEQLTQSQQAQRRADERLAGTQDEQAAQRAAHASAIAELQVAWDKEREALAARYEQGLARIEKTVIAKEGLITQANEIIAALQGESERLRELLKREREERRQTRAAEALRHKEEIAGLEAERAKLRSELKEIEKFVADHDDLRRIKEFNQVRLSLEQQIREQEATVDHLAYALSVFRDICARSPAARSIIAGASGDLDLDELFDMLE